MSTIIQRLAAPFRRAGAVHRGRGSRALFAAIALAAALFALTSAVATATTRHGARHPHHSRVAGAHYRPAAARNTVTYVRLRHHSPMARGVLLAQGGHRRHRLHRGRIIASGSGSGELAVRSASALIIDQDSGAPIYAKNDRAVVPIASITKLMTALVVLDAAQPMDETIEITDGDVDRLKASTSRLHVGARLTRETLLRLALMASENRAASSLARSYPGGTPAFVAAMNRKARALNMTDSHFADATGLNSQNVSTARDLVQLVDEGWRNPYVRAYTTTSTLNVRTARRELTFNNTNPLVKANDWHISLSKTGFIEEAGRCLVMRATLAQKDVVIVLLNSQGKYTRIGDAHRVRQWMEAHRNELPGASIALVQRAATAGAAATAAAATKTPGTQLTHAPESPILAAGTVVNDLPFPSSSDVLRTPRSSDGAAAQPARYVPHEQFRSLVP